jgi:hypothetical protein
MNDEAIVRLLQRAAKEEEDPRLAELLSPPSEARKQRMVAAVVPTRKRSALVVLAPLAVAAAILLFFLWRPAHQLPEYELTIAGQVQEQRAQPAPSGAVRTTFELVARPASRIDKPVAPRAALVHDGRATPWNPPFETDPGGSVRIAGDPRALFPGAGVYEIVLVLSHDPPGDAELTAIARGEPTRHRVLRASVRVE